MENLNAEEIKCGLEHCTAKSYKCEECPYFYKSEGIKSSMEILMTDALALITSQEQRIKELDEENERLRADKEYWKNRTKESESEYNQAVKRGYNLGAVDYVRSFAERLNKECLIDRGYEVLLEGTIDQIAKEMLEDTE